MCSVSHLSGRHRIVSSFIEGPRSGITEVKLLATVQNDLETDSESEASEQAASLTLSSIALQVKVFCCSSKSTRVMASESEWVLSDRLRSAMLLNGNSSTDGTAENGVLKVKICTEIWYTSHSYKRSATRQPTMLTGMRLIPLTRLCNRQGAGLCV